MLKLFKVPMGGVKSVSLALVLAIFVTLLLAAPTFANEPVGYGEADHEAVGTINSALQKVATSIRNVLGYTGLVTLLAAAIVAHFVHDPRSKEKARELVVIAILGLVIAAFAPTLINWVEGLARGLGG